MTQETGNNIVIDLRHLGKVYGSGHVAVKAVDDVSLHVVKGEIIAIMGALPARVKRHCCR